MLCNKNCPLLSDVDVPHPDEKSIITYVSSLYDAMPRVDVHDGARANVSSTSWKAFDVQLILNMLQINMLQGNKHICCNLIWLNAWSDLIKTQQACDSSHEWPFVSSLFWHIHKFKEK